MADIKISLPAVLKIANNSDKDITFVPYKENFVTAVPKGMAVEFAVNTSEQALYYLAQATNGLEVTKIADFDAPVDGGNLIVIKTPAKVTLTNSGNSVMNFIPYKEGFVQEIAVGDSLELEVKNFSQVLYYLSQETKGLSVEQAPVAAGQDNE